MKTRTLKTATTLLAGAALLFIGTTVLAHDHQENQKQSAEKYSEKETVQTPAVETVRFAVLSNAEPKSGWCGFNERLARNIRYPEYLKQMGIEATINVQFAVDKDGNIDRVRTATANPMEISERHINVLKEEAKRAVMKSFGEWRPSTLDGEPVNSSTFNVPVSFKVDYLTIR